MPDYQSPKLDTDRCFLPDLAGLGINLPIRAWQNLGGNIEKNSAVKNLDMRK